AAELHLFAVSCEILLDLDDELAVGEPQPIAFRRPEHVGVGCAGKGGCRMRVAGVGHQIRLSLAGIRSGLQRTESVGKRCFLVEGQRRLATGLEIERGYKAVREDVERRIRVSDRLEHAVAMLYRKGRVLDDAVQSPTNP